jgi:hypothetical protein
MKTISLALISLLLCAAAHPQTAPAKASTVAGPPARQALKKYVTELQESPDDNDLRLRIIKLATTLKPPPAIPEEARRYYLKAFAIQRDAKTAQEVEPAITSYQQALLLAPWWADAYSNLSSALEMAGRYAEAISALKLYLASNPKDARKAQDRIYLIEGEQERAAVEQKARAQKEAEERAQQQAAQKRRQQEEAAEQARLARLRNLNGTWYRDWGNGTRDRWSITVSGNQIVGEKVASEWGGQVHPQQAYFRDSFRGTINGNSLSGTYSWDRNPPFWVNGQAFSRPFTGATGEGTITVHYMRVQEAGTNTSNQVIGWREYPDDFVLRK